MSGTLAPSTPTSRRLAGITAFTVNGSNFSVTEFAWDPGPVERETMTSLSGVDGYRELPVAAYISGKFRDAQSVNISGFVGLTNATVVVQLANGKQVVGHNLWFVGRPATSGADSTFDFRFEGASGTVQELGALLSDTSPPPEPVSWELPSPVTFGGSTYATVTLRAPNGGDVLKATAVPGSSGMEITLRLIAAINAEGIPYEALLALPAWAIDQMSTYLDMFNRSAPAAPFAPRLPWRAWRLIRPFRLPRLPYIGHIPSALRIGPRSLLDFEPDDLRIGAAITGRFYGEGITWVLALPVHELRRWNKLMRRVAEKEQGK